MLEFLGNFFAGLFGFAGAGTAAGVGSQNTKDANATNLQIARETNAANKQIAADTNRENRLLAHQAMQFNQMESDKAYSRSTPLNQIAELVRAGYSEQQAKQIVAGSGSAAAYTPAPAVTPTMNAAQMQPAQVQPFVPDAGSLSSAFANVGGSLGSFADDVLRSDGGFIGQYYAMPAVKALFKFMSKFDENDLTSIKSFSDWFNSDKSKFLSHSERSTISNCLSHPNGARALMAQLNSFYNSFSDSKRYKSLNLTVQQQTLQNQISRIQQSLLEGQVDLQDIEISMQELARDKQIQLQPFEVQATMQNLLASFNQAVAQTELWSNEEFKKQWLANQLENENVRALLLIGDKMNAQIQNMSLEAANDFMLKNKQMFGIYDLFKKAGMTSNVVGSLIAAVVANGENLHDLYNYLFVNESESQSDKSNIAHFLEPENNAFSAGIKRSNLRSKGIKLYSSDYGDSSGGAGGSFK